MISIRERNYPTLTQLFHGLSEEVLFQDKEECEAYSGLTTCSYGWLARASSMEYELNVGKEMWFTKHRWPRLLRDYIAVGTISPFLDRVEQLEDKAGKRGVIAELRTRSVRTKGGKEVHSWGNCMMGWTYRGGTKWGNTPHLTLHSRVSYIGYVGGLDLALCYVLAREIAERARCSVEDIQFTWVCDSLQWHGFKSIPYIFGRGLAREIMNEDDYPTSQYPAVGMTRRSIRTMAKAYREGKRPTKEDFIYGPVRRMNARFQQVVCNKDPMPDIHLSDLHLLEELL